MFEDVDNPLSKVADAIASGWTRMFGSRNDRLIREILPVVRRINEELQKKPFWMPEGQPQTVKAHG